MKIVPSWNFFGRIVYICGNSNRVEKIKVLRIINRFSIGGPSFNAIILTKHLTDDFETKLIGGIPDEGEADSFYVLNNYDVNATTIHEMRRSLNFFSDLKSYFKIKQIIKEYKPDIVHTHASKAGALGRWAAYRSGVKIIVHTYHGHVFHSYFGKFKTSIYKWVERYLAKKSSGIVAICASQKHELSEVYAICPASKIQIIPLGLSLDAFLNNSPENRKLAREKLGVQHDAFVLGIVGRLAPIKDHHYFLDVVESILARTKQKIKVFIVGDGLEMQDISARVDRMNKVHGDIIVLTSWVKDMAPMYHAFDVVCLTSKNEGTPVTLIEAQAAGLPVISTDVGGVKDLVENGKSGYLIPRERQDEYVNKLLELMSSSALREKMGAHGKKQVEEKYTYRRLVSDMGQFYRKLLQSLGTA